MIDKLNLGCGAQVVEGWVNIDYSMGARLSKIPLFSKINRVVGIFNVKWDSHIKIHDLRKPLPYKDNTIHTIYASHLLEHLNREDGVKLINECHRILRPEGIVRIVVPDLRYIVNQYLNGEIEAERFCEELRISREHKKSLRKILSNILAFPHQCMYDQKALLSLITKIGFQAEVKSQFDSLIADIKTIEIDNRSDGSAVIVEGMKINNGRER